MLASRGISSFIPLSLRFLTGLQHVWEHDIP
jgi:hypothetical protein